MTKSKESSLPMILMLLLVMAVQIMSMALTPVLLMGEVRIFEDPTSAVNPLSYVLMVLGFTALLLLAFRLKRGWMVAGFIYLAVAMTLFYVLSAMIPSVPSAVLSIAAMIILYSYPEWYVVDAIGLILCAGVSTIFGISMTIIPALLLLIVLAVYDAISVYKTRHMISLAESAIELKAPLLFVVPRHRGYSFRRSEGQMGQGRGANLLGLGDAIIPTVLAVSASWSVGAAPMAAGINAPAAGAMLGTYAGFLALMTTSRERPQAGLPFLNGGAILGFLLACALLGINPFQ